MSCPAKVRNSQTTTVIQLLKGKKLVGYFQIGPGRPLAYQAWVDKKFPRRKEKSHKHPPCTYCNGKGWDYDPRDNCPVEGYKMADPITCQTCKGTGIGPRIFVQWLYDAYCETLVEEFNRDYAVFQTLQAACSKLTADEVKAIVAARWIAHKHNTSNEANEHVVMKV